MKRYHSLTALFLLALLQGARPAVGMVHESSKRPAEPLRLIVKFKPGYVSTLESVLPTSTMELRSTSTGNAAKNFFLKHPKAKKLRPAFSHFVKQKIRSGKSDSELAEDTRIKFPKRARRHIGRFDPPPLSPYYIVEGFSSEQEMAATEDSLQKDPNLESVAREHVYLPQATPNDPYWSTSGSWGQNFADLWGLHKIQADGAWDTADGSGVIVAVVDTGVDYTHPDIAANMWVNPADGSYGYDFVGADYRAPVASNDPMDHFGHGTHVAGTIAAAGNNNLGVIGVAYKAKIMAVKVGDNQGILNEDAILNGIQYAADHGAQVLNMSFGGVGDDPAMEAALQYAYAHGLVLVAAAGNNDIDASQFFPASSPEVITVSAFDNNDTIASFSNFGSKIDVAAPGVNILSLNVAGSVLSTQFPSHVVGAKYLELDGTSMAAPHVAGLAALILSQHPAYDNEQVRQVIRQSADDVGAPGWDLNSGYGRINVFKALAEPSPMKSKILSPVSAAVVSQFMPVMGTAGGSGFSSYRLEIGTGSAPMSWNLLAQGDTSVLNAVLGNLDPKTIPKGPALLRLVVFNRDGSSITDQIQITMSGNGPINPPPPTTGGVHQGLFLVNVEMGMNGTMDMSALAKPMAGMEMMTSKYHYLLAENGQIIELVFPKNSPLTITPNSWVRVTGSVVGGQIQLPDVTAASIQVIAKPAGIKSAASVMPAGLSPSPQSSSIGGQKTAVLLVNFTNATYNQPTTVAQALDVDFNQNTVFYRQESYNTTWFYGDVYGYYSVDPATVQCGSMLGLAAAADAAAAAAGVDLSSYSRKQYVIAGTPCAAWAGLAYIGGAQSFVLSPYFDLRVVPHELGHNLGLWHAHSIDCVNVPLNVTSKCAGSEYGNPFDIMGDGFGGVDNHHINALHRTQLGWITPQTITTSGIYTINPLDNSGAGVKALKINSHSNYLGNYSYYLEYHQASGPWPYTESQVLQGVMINLESPLQAPFIDVGSNLLDMTPGDGSKINAPLAIGSTFTDPGDAGVVITPLSVDANGIQVQITVPVIAPAITQQPFSPTTTEGQAVNFSVGASGTAPLSYQWYKNGAAISGATGSSYFVLVVPLSDDGSTYYVVVNNVTNNPVTSNTVTLRVNPAQPASITQQPANVSVAVGGAASFTVNASGTQPLNFQWYRNGNAIPGATGTVYNIPSVALADNGAQFTVVVNNVKNVPVTSTAASLSVIPTLPPLSFNLMIDRTNYLIGEAAAYTISGAPPNSSILWSSWQNGNSTGENNVDYGQKTDGQGNWSSPAGAWGAGQIGSWTKQASIGGRTAQINFYVSADLPSLTSGPVTPASQMLGVDDWNGAYPEFHLSSDPLPVEDAKIIQNLNAKTILIPMGPTISADFPNTNFGGSINNLTDLAKSAPFQQIFAMSFSTYVLTAYAYTDQDHLGSANLAAEQQEISDLTVYLLQTYRGTGKTFIIKNWEGDHELYGHDPSHPPPANEHQYPYTFSADPTITAKMIAWLNARHQGVLQGRTQAGAVAGVAVHDAAEFVYLYEPLKNLPSMLTTVIPSVSSDYISYSAYDTINRSLGSSVPLRRAILDDFTYLRHYSGLNGKPLIVGEFGYSWGNFPLTGAPNDAATRAAIAVQAFRDLSIPLSLYWVAADYANGFGLSNPNNTRTAVWNAFRTLLAPQNNSVLLSAVIPSQMVPGGTYPVTIQMQNTGTVPWDDVDTYRLASQNPSNNTVWGMSRINLTAGESIAPGASKTFQFSVTAPATAGRYTMQWQMIQEVVGGFGVTLSSAVTVAANQPPFVSACTPSASSCPNQTLTLPSYTVLLGSATDDGLPFGILSTTWSVVSGPGPVIFNSTYTAVTTANFFAPGTYVLQLTANDGQASASSTITVNVNPALPRPTSDMLLPQYDIVIVGAGSGGVSAAIQAARMGAKVALIEPTDWIGGQMTAAGVTSLDEGTPVDRQAGLYKEFIAQLLTYYAGLGKSVNTCYFDNTHIAFEPSVGEALLYQMVLGAKTTSLAKGGKLDLSLYTQVTGVQKSGSSVTGVTVSINIPGSGPSVKTISSSIVIDASEYGDVMPLASVRYRTGNATSDAPAPNQIQDITYTATIKRYPAGVPPALRVGAPSTNYAPTFYPSIFSKMFVNDSSKAPFAGNWDPVTLATKYPYDWSLVHNVYRGMPDSTNPANYDGSSPGQISKTGINWANDYPGNQSIQFRWNGYLSSQYLEDPVYRQQINCQAKIMTLDFVYFVQHDLGHSDWSLADDEGYDSPYNIQQNSCGALIPAGYQSMERYVSVIPYVRESRRMIGLHTMTAPELSRTGPLQFDTGLPTAIKHSTSSLAIGSYPADIHGLKADSVLETSLEKLADYANANLSGQFQVPFEAFIPEAVDGFLAAEKNISVTRIVNGAIREQPISMLTGQAAGAIAATAVQRGMRPRDLNPVWVQAALLQAQSSLSLYHFPDVPQTNFNWFAVQLVSAHELMVGQANGQFNLSGTLTREALAVIVAKFLQLPINNPPATPTFPDETSSNFGYVYVEALHTAGVNVGVVPGGNFLPNNNSTRADVAVFMASGLHFNVMTISSTPYFADVPPSHPAFKYIQVMAQQNLLNSCGTSGGSPLFCPDTAETRSQAAQDMSTILQTIPSNLAPLQNLAPIVSAGPDQTIRLPSNASLMGTVSDDGLLRPVSSTWTVLSGPGIAVFSSTYTPTTSVSFSAAGVYGLQLQVFDGQYVAVSSMTVVVQPANQPPVVSACTPAVAPCPGQVVTLPSAIALNGAVSDDGLPNPPQTVVTTWSKLSFSGVGPGTVLFGSSTAPVTTAQFSDPGTYVLRLTADDGALQSTNDLSITVNSNPFWTPPSTSSTTIQLLGDPSFSNGIRAFNSCSQFDGPPTVNGAPLAILGNCIAYKTAPTGYMLRTLPDAGPPDVTSDRSKFWNFNEGVHIGPFTVNGYSVPAGQDLQIHRFEANSILLSNTPTYFWIQSMNNVGVLPGDPQYNQKLVRTFTSDHQGNVNLYAVTQNEIRNVATQQSGAFASDTWPHYYVEQNFKQLIDMALFSRIDASLMAQIPQASIQPDGGLFPYKNAAFNVGMILRQKGNPDVVLFVVYTPFSLNPVDYQEALGVDQFGQGLYRGDASAAGGPLVIGGPPKAIQFELKSAVNRALLRGNSSLTADDFYLAEYGFGWETVGYEIIQSLVSQTSLLGTLVPSGNQPPTVSAGTDQTIMLPSYAVLRGTATDDGLPYGILSTTWSVVSGPGSVIFSSTYTPVTNAIFSTSGIYALQLTASDGALIIASSVTITVNPNPCTAVAGIVNVRACGARGDGITDDSLALNNAAIAASGVTLYFPTGTYLSSGLALLPNTTLSASNAILKGLSGSGNILSLANGTIVDGVEIDGSGMTGGNAIFVSFGTGIVIKNSYIHDCKGVCIEVDNTTNYIIKNNRIQNSSGQCIDLIFSNQGQVTSNSVDTCAHGIQWWGGDAAVNPATTYIYDLTITSNTVKNSQGGCIWGSRGQRILVNGNSVQSCSDVGIDSEGGLYGLITGNSAQDAVNGGITTFYGTSMSTITNNTITQSAGMGPGIKFYGPGGGQNIVVSDNLIHTTNSAGIISDGSVLSGYLIDGNSIKVDSAASGIELHFAGFCANTTLSNNTMTSAPGLTTIMIDTGGAGSCSGCVVVEGNHVTVVGNPTSAFANTVASALPNPVYGSSTTLSLLADGYLSCLMAPLTYTWSASATPLTPISFIPNGTPAAQTCVAAFAQGGTYVIQATATDLNGNTVVSSTGVMVNVAPIVRAGPDQTITLPNFAVLQGTATDDGLPYGILSTTWSVVSGPAPVVFSSTYTPVTNANFSQPGTYVLQLSATDGVLLSSSSATIVVTQTNFAISPSSLTFSATLGGSNPANQIVDVSNTGTAATTWTSSSDSAWLAVSPPSGGFPALVGNQLLSVSVDLSSLSVGLHTGHITFSDASSTWTLTIGFNVAGVPTLNVSTTTLAFTAVIGSSNPIQNLTVINSGTGISSWSVTSDALWLSAVPSSGTLAAGTGSQVLTVTSALGSLAAGSYTGHLTFTDQSGVPTVVTVTFKVIGVPNLSVVPSSMTFSATASGGNPASQLLQVKNTGTADSVWTASSDADWLSISQPSGTTLALIGSQLFSVSVNVNALAMSSYTGHITYVDQSGLPKVLTVTLTIPAPNLSVSPSTFTFNTAIGQSSPPSQTIAISNSGDANSNWNAGSDASWLSVAPTNGTALAITGNQLLSVSAVRGSLTVGTYIGHLTFTDQTNVQNVVAVTLTVHPPPTPTANSQSVTTAFNTAKSMTLTGMDPSSLPITYSVTAGPSHGLLTGTAPTLTYTPTNGYSGADSFSFTVNNGFVTSVPAAVSITISTPTAPTATAQNVVVGFNSTQTITLMGTDPNGLTLIYAVTVGPAHGTLVGTAPTLTYTPTSGYSGSDSFGFTVNNGFVTSPQAAITITVSGPPPPPPPPPPPSGPGTPPSAPDLSALDGKTFSPTDTIILPYSGSANNFVWEFSPVSAGVPGLNAAAVGEAYQASGNNAAISTPSPRLSLSALTLPTGAYILRIQALNNGQPSAWASAHILWVSSVDFSAVKIFPNPWRGVRGDGPISFKQLPINSTVKLFTVSGRWVKTLNAASGETSWDLTNDAGEKVASGLYIYLITDSQNNKVKGKLGVVR